MNFRASGETAFQGDLLRYFLLWKKKVNPFFLSPNILHLMPGGVKIHNNQYLFTTIKKKKNPHTLSGIWRTTCRMSCTWGMTCFMKSGGGGCCTSSWNCSFPSLPDHAIAYVHANGGNIVVNGLLFTSLLSARNRVRRCSRYWFTSDTIQTADSAEGNNKQNHEQKKRCK